jgi:diguanylate cyclase (GGDEF)-like protein/PAS domain S-box-containing protein
MTSLLRTKRLLWLVIFALVTVMAWLSYLSGRRYVRAVAWVEHTQQVQATIDDVLSAVVAAEDSNRGFLLTHDDDLLAASRAATGSVPTLLAHLGELTRDNPSQQARLRELSTLANDKLLFVAETGRLSQSGEQTEALALVRGGRGVALMTELRSAANAMDREEHRLLELRKRDAEQAQNVAIWGVGVGSVLTIAMSLVSLLSVHRDVEELRQTAEELADRERYFRLLTENSRDLVRIADWSSKVTYVSPSVERMLGYTPEELLTFPPLSLVHPDDVALFQPSSEPIYERYKGAQLQYRIRHKDGSYHWLEINFAAHIDSSGEVVGVQSSARDVTERHVAEERLAAQAAELRSLSLGDELTGLYNRRGWLELSRQGLRLAQREKRSAGVIFVDLNGMKLINDQYGHEAGDRALRDTAGLLKKACREVDVIARFGGDEFVVFALDFDPSGLEVLQQRVRAASTELNLSGDRRFQLSMSVGAAFFKPETPESIDELLDRADREMYSQKRARKQNGVSLRPPAPS